ncbi:hypothetical protein CCACVL1_02411 [Corchorus capsularis]|uniref:Uncharacterized protein n=1 Tax=Corchorus capsularis TaxID=210143 RepID=A0A1R3K8P6_COCAP|nr:hypothetical protein CCACVL1_02411 [Corchorus capsularis]
MAISQLSTQDLHTRSDHTHTV